MSRPEPDPNAPTRIEDLPDYWDLRREREGKPDFSRCAEELRAALGHYLSGKALRRYVFALEVRIQQLESRDVVPLARVDENSVAISKLQDRVAALDGQLP